ncbi:MAG TPA: hypothetical protein VES03_05590 [Motilibacterales bacterium]|nr:hypothetical protein [Motilibacterales bacterium]
MTVRTWSTPRESLDRLVTCAREEVGSPTWWGLLTRHVDELRDELAIGDVEGLAAQITTDAPHLAASAARLPLLDKQVKSELSQLRILVADAYGSTTAAAPVRDAVEVALRHVRTLNRTADDLMLDAYERDFGGQ